jgi:cyclophilin family peptidyl-prolyl cis-trans isomerase
MKKALYYVLAVSFVFLLAGCSNQQAGNKDAIANPATDPGQYVSDMNNLKNNMEQNIQNAADQENKKINEAMNETSDNSNNNTDMDYVKNYTGAVLKTSMGDIQVKFNNTATPNTVNNFLKLADQKFYDGTKFHRVIKGFMIQSGDPNSKDDDWSNDGTGGPGYKFADELAGTEKYPQGTLAMANSGPNTNGSQFFIVTASPEAPLPPSYTVFGQVVSGMDTALKIENVQTNANDHPTKDVVINSIELVK